MTHQAAETLTYNQEQYDMECDGIMNPYPLASYLRVTGKDVILNRASISSACHRGYIGEWEIKDGCLYLTGITGELGNSKELELKDLFPKSKKNVFASWFTGEIRCGVGKPNRIGASPLQIEQYEKYLSFMFLSGRLVSGKFVDYHGATIEPILIPNTLSAEQLESDDMSR